MSKSETDRLDKYCEIVMGQSPSGESYNYEGKGLKLIAGAGDFGEVYPRAKKYTTEASKISKYGDIVLGIRASIGDKVLSDGEYCLGRGVAGLRPLSKLDARYLWHWLDHIRPILSAKSKGATFKQVNREDICELEISILQLAEQKRIAEILDRTQSLISKRKEAIAKLDTLTQSIFLEMFGDPFTNPKGWDIAKVGEIAEVQGGLQVSSSRKKYPREVPYLRVANVYRGFLNLSEIKMICATDTEISRTLLQNDDLLIVEGHGNPNEIGRVALWNGSIVNCIHQNHIIRARFNQSKIIPLYACYYLNSAGGRQHLLKSGKTTSGLNTISVSEVRSSPVSMPPLGLQKEFAQRVEAVEKLKATHRASLSELQALFASLQHRAFRGEL